MKCWRVNKGRDRLGYTRLHVDTVGLGPWPKWRGERSLGLLSWIPSGYTSPPMAILPISDLTFSRISGQSSQVSTQCSKPQVLSFSLRAISNAKTNFVARCTSHHLCTGSAFRVVSRANPIEALDNPQPAVTFLHESFTEYLCNLRGV